MTTKSLTGVDRVELTHNAAGGTLLVAVLQDGRRVSLPPDTRASAFKGAPYVWNPQQYPADPHEEDFSKQGGAETVQGPLTATGGREPDLDDEPIKLAMGCGDPTHPDGCDCGEEGRAETPCASDEMGDYAGTDAQGAVDDDEDADEHQVELGLVGALDSTIVACYRLAEGNEELRRLLSKARWQINEMRGDRADGAGDDAADDVSVKLAEIRAMGGELPAETLTVGQGLRAIAESGFAGVMQPSPT